MGYGEVENKCKVATIKYLEKKNTFQGNEKKGSHLYRERWRQAETEGQNHTVDSISDGPNAIT